MAIKAFELFGTVEVKNTASAELRRVDRDVDRTKKNLTGLKGALSGALHLPASAMSGANSALGTLGNISEAIQAIPVAGKLITGAVSAIAGPIKDLAQTGLAFNDLKENATLAFSVILRDGEKAKKLFADIAQFGKDSPIFKTADLIKYSQGFLPKLGAGPELFQSLKGIGALTASTGDMGNMPEVMRAMRQILTKPKLSAEEMNQQLADAGIAGWDLLAGGLGKSAGEVQAMTSRGQISGEGAFKVMVSEALRKYGSLVDMMGGTRTGLQARIDDEMEQLAATGTGNLHGTWKAGQQRTLSALQGPKGQQLAGQINNATGVIGGAVMGGFDSLLDGSLLTKAQSAAQNVVGTAQGTIQGAAQSAKQTMTDYAASLAEGFTDYWVIKSPSQRAIYLGQMIADGLEIGLKKHGNDYKALVALAQGAGFDVTSTTGGKHNPGSVHGRGKAIDVRTRNKTPAEVEAFMAQARAMGLTVLDERERPAGQKVWGGPHLHLQYGTEGLSARGLAKAGVSGGARPAANLGGDLEALVQANAAKYGVRPEIIRAIIMTESSGRPGVSDYKTGKHKGLMQISPTVAGMYGVTDPFNPAQNVGAGTAYFASLMKQFGGDERKALAAYHTGPGTVSRRGITGDGETYINKVLGNVSAANPLPVAVVGMASAKAGVSGGDPFSGPGFEALAGRIEGEGFGYGAAMDAKAAITLPTGTLRPGTLTDMALAADAATRGVTKLAEGAELTAEQIKKNNDLAVIPGAEKKKKDKLFDSALTKEGIAGDFQGNLQGALMNPFSKKSWAGAGMGFLKDIQARAAHDVSSMLTGALFGTRGEDGKLGGGLLSSLLGGLFGGGGKDGKGGGGGFLSSIFGKIFGGFRASGGPVSSGSLYVVGENGPEVFMPGAGGQILNGRQMAGAMAGGEQREQRFIFVDSEREAQRHRSARSENFVMNWRTNRHIINRMGR